MTKLHKLALGVGMAAFVLPVWAGATTITLDTSILPSAQGWTYFSPGALSSVPETDFFSNVGGELVQNTIGSGLTPGGDFNFYYHPISIAPGQAFRLSVVARVAQSEQVLAPGSILAPYGFIFSVSTDPDYYLTSVAANGQVSIVFDGFSAFQLPGTFDPGAYNLYEVSGGGGSFSLKFNGTTVFSGAAPLNFPSPQLLLLGDGSSTANANVFIRSYSFTTDVPEPASWALMLAGFGLVGSAMRRRQAVKASYA
jgi:PEP-CTERM motif